MIVLLRRVGANRTGNYSYHPKKKKIVRGDSPPCGFTPAQVIILITLLKKKNVRGDSPPCGFTPART